MADGVQRLALQGWVPSQEMDTTSLTTVASYLHRGDAELARVQLDAAGIDAIVRADDEGGLNPGFFSEFRVRVVVRSDNRAAALEELGIVEESVFLPDEALEALVAHTRFCAPLEACGLVAMNGGGEIRMVYPLTNVDASPVRHTVDPYEHLMATRHAEANGWVIAGAFHSHPTSVPTPSSRDVAGALDPTWLYLIVGPATDPEVRAYRIGRSEVAEVALR